MATDCTNRIFEILNAFTTSERAKRNFSETSPINGGSNYNSDPSEILQPSEEAKARLIQAMHTVEDIFIAYGRDTIERVVEDLKNQQELRTGQNNSFTSANQRKNYPKKRVFTIKHDLAISTNLLLNDIQAYADRNCTFRMQNPEYFDFGASSESNV